MTFGALYYLKNPPFGIAAFNSDIIDLGITGMTDYFAMLLGSNADIAFLSVSSILVLA